MALQAVQRQPGCGRRPRASSSSFACLARSASKQALAPTAAGPLLRTASTNRAAMACDSRSYQSTKTDVVAATVWATA